MVAAWVSDSSSRSAVGKWTATAAAAAAAADNAAATTAAAAAADTAATTVAAATAAAVTAVASATAANAEAAQRAALHRRARRPLRRGHATPDAVPPAQPDRAGVRAEPAYGHPRGPAIASLLRHHPKTPLKLPIRTVLVGAPSC